MYIYCFHMCNAIGSSIQTGDGAITSGGPSPVVARGFASIEGNP